MNLRLKKIIDVICCSMKLPYRHNCLQFTAKKKTISVRDNIDFDKWLLSSRLFTTVIVAHCGRGSADVRVKSTVHLSYRYR
jgi:hypothetical protein